MCFFKSFKPSSDESIPEQDKRSNKLRYVIDKANKGRWIKPKFILKRLAYDFEDDIIY